MAILPLLSPIPRQNAGPVCHRNTAGAGDTPKILIKITGMTLDESLTVTHNKTIGLQSPAS